MVLLVFRPLQGKEVATDVRLLPQGTVIFEDISIEQFEGTVVKVIPKVPTKNQASQIPPNQTCRPEFTGLTPDDSMFWVPQNDPLPGRISARIGFADKELPFGEKDTKSKVTLLEGDHIQFNISTDRRDKLERATNIDILPDTFNFTKETREMVRDTQANWNFWRSRKVFRYFLFLALVSAQWSTV